MLIPTREQAEALLREAEALNPGPWAAHSRYAALAAQRIADRHPTLDSEPAYVLGLLHDIGRRVGVTGMRHVLDGYRFLAGLGYDDAARVAMTHSFPNRDVREIFGGWDCDEHELAFLQAYLATSEYTDYDRLIQLCDSCTDAAGFCLMEKRMLDVAFRYGINAFSIPKWKAIFRIKETFEAAMACSLYSLLPGVVENTFGLQKEEA